MVLKMEWIKYFCYKWIEINFSIIKKELLQLQNESLQFQGRRHAWLSYLFMMKLIACIVGCIVAQLQAGNKRKPKMW